VGIIAVLVALAWMSPLRGYMAMSLHGGYRLLHIDGENFAGRSNALAAVFLVGDAGSMTEGVMKSLVRAAQNMSAPKLIYLGDNIYPNGLPASPETAEWRHASAQLLRQIEPFRALTGGIFFTPGNHDWENHSAGGWEAMKRQSAFIEAALGTGHMAPSNGCPGPTKVDLLPDLQAIALDSSWWLHNHVKPTLPQDGCENFTEDAVVSALDEMLTNTPAGVDTLLILHHPLLPPDSDHAHSKCPFSPDCPTYASMREKLTAVIGKHRPLLCASGHNHSLQVHHNQAGCRTYVVSGGGSTAYQAEQPKNAIFAEAALGFMILYRDPSAGWKLDVVRARADDSPLPRSSSLAFSTSVQ